MSLTNDPDNRFPFEGPPEFVKKKDALEYVFDRMIDEEVYPQLIEGLERGIPVMDTTRMILFQGFTEGKWNPDLLMLMAEPTAYIIMALAERAGVDYVIDNEQDDEEVEELGIKEVDQKLKKVKSRIAGTKAEGNIPLEIKEKIEETPLPSIVERPSKKVEPEEMEEPIAEQEDPSASLVPRRA